MSSVRKTVADILFAIQILGALAVTGSQFFRMLVTIEGVNLAMFLVMELFLGMNLFLAIKANAVQASRVTRQTVATYALWFVLIASNIAAIWWHGGYRWSNNDFVTIALTILGVLCVLAIAARFRKTYSDPIVKGWLAVFFKGVPQLLLAYKMFLEGNAGTPGLSIIAGHITINVRLGQLLFSIREARWDRNRIGSAISEFFNELSWIAVTVVWLIKELS